MTYALSVTTPTILGNSGITEGRELGVEWNHRLEQAMDDAHITAGGLSRRMRAIADADDVELATNHTDISRWLRGTVPRERTAGYLARAISERLGRVVSPADLGMAPKDMRAADLGLAYTTEAADGVEALAELWRADLDGDPVVVEAATSSPAWSQASLAWLIGGRAPTRTEPVDGRRVGMAEVTAVRATADVFATLDNRFGGAHARTALIRFLSDDVEPLLSARHTEPVRRALFGAAAEATLLAAWMSYDSCRHGLAQRYFIQALRLAEAGDDRLLAGSILSAMSHQATFVGRYREAAELARAAVAGIAACGTDTLRAQFTAMEARALARAGEARSCDLAMVEAVRHFERRHPDDDPIWIGYFDDAELAAELGHCTRDLGRAAAAVLHAGHSLSPDGSYVRSDFFATMVLADAHAAAGDLEQAALVAGQALDLGAALKSSRCSSYLREFRGRLITGGGIAVLAHLDDEHAEHPLWIASAA